MPILTFTFPGKRYHATPWGAHVNEAQIEWPPSPWRICRALLATGMTKLGWHEDDLPSRAIELLAALSAALPEYRLPQSPEPLTVAHTRHYMPIPGNTTKVFDGFAHVGDEPLRVSWPIDISPDAYRLLEQLVARMSYLGRAESWVDASLAPGTLEDANCRPCTTPELAEADEPVILLAPMTAADFQSWRAAQLAARPELAATRGRRGKGKVATALVPDNLVECMLRSTDDLQRQGWSLPPGARRVLYSRPRDALVASQPARTPPLRLVRQPVECALIALTSYAVNGEVLPGIERTVPQMEQLHRALASLLDERGDGAPCSQLTGRGDDKSPLQHGHRHAHYLPLSLRPRTGSPARTCDLSIDHILVYAPAGLPEPAQRALDRLRWIHSASVAERRDDDRDDDRDDERRAGPAAGSRRRGDEPDDERRRRDHERRKLTTTLVATGDLDVIREALSGRDLVDLLGESKVWQSHTPFVAPRFVKNRHTVEDQVRAELRSRDLPEPTDIEVLPRDEIVDAGFLRFVRTRRRNRPQPPTTHPWSLRLRFSEPVRGPLALGYASHFGLGLFRPLAG